MPKVSPIQSGFNAGELSPFLDARSDLDRYRKGLALCSNFLPLVQGGLMRRPGTRYVKKSKAGATVVRLVSFEFSTTQAYILEFGHDGAGYMRVFKDRGAVLEANKVLTGATQADPVVIASTGHSYSDGDEVFIDNIVGMVEINARFFIVANKTANTFELQGEDGTSHTVYASGGTAGKVFEMALPFDAADIFQLKFAQSADNLYVAHEDYAPRKITRTAHDAWSITVIDFKDGPYLPTNSNESFTLTASAETGSVTLTASSALFVATDVGRMVRLRGSYIDTEDLDKDDDATDSVIAWGWAKITAFTSTTVVTIAVQNRVSKVATDEWRLGLWSDTTGYPGAVTFFENRLSYGASRDAPQRMDASKSADFEVFEPSDQLGVVADDSALAFNLNADNVNSILWMRGEEKGMVIGTAGGEWVVRPSTQSEALSPTNVSAKRSTKLGSRNVQPIQAGKATLFLQKSGRKLREFAYSFQNDGFNSLDLTILANHILKVDVIEMAYQNEPQSIVWLVQSDGHLLGLTYERDEDVVGWHHQPVAGVSDAAGAAAKVESVAVIPDPANSRDELWLSVQRWVDGAAVRHVEFMTELWEDVTPQEDAFFVDTGLTYDGPAVLTISGLEHLEGETVQVLADGAVHPDLVVADRAITLNRPGAKVHIGLGYVSDGKTLPFDAGAADGTAQGKLRRIHRVVFRLWKTLGFKVGPDVDSLDTVPFRSGGDLMDAPPPLFTGDIEVSWGGDYDNRGEIYFRQDQPLPCTVLAIMPHMVTQDR